MTPEIPDMQRELTINQAIDDRLNGILQQMKVLVDNSRIWEAKKMEVSQIQNLLAVSQETGSVEVVKNYIRYQMGRDGGSDSWRNRMGTGPTFGEQVIDAVDNLRSVAASIVPEEKNNQAEIDRTWMKLTRLYLGYLRRYFYYKKRG